MRPSTRPFLDTARQATEDVRIAEGASLDIDLLHSAKAEMIAILEKGIERSRISPTQVPVIAVGGGSILMPNEIGELKVVRPENFAVANAVGAAIAQVRGEIDRVFSLVKGLTREICTQQAEDEARTKAIAAGAQPHSIEVIERDDVPLAYLPGNATRIHVKIVGEIADMSL